ncbi:MAG: hypothetical protein AB1714_00500 [Acidobacteriota bacterium]
MADFERSEYVDSLATHCLRYGLHRLFLSSRDYEIIQSWWNLRIPRGVVLTGIDSAYLARLRHGRLRRVPPRNLDFAVRHVERAWEAYKELRAGARRAGGRRRKADFGRVSGHMQRLRDLLEQLDAATATAESRGHQKLAARLLAVAGYLRRARPDASVFEAEEWLGKAAAGLDRALPASLEPDVVEEARARARRDLAEYSSHDAFTTYVEKMALATLREEYPLPILSLL